MELPVINSRADLDAVAGTPAHDAFMAKLAGTLWRLERDDEAKTWRAVADDTVIARFGFIRADFPGAQPPALPVYDDSQQQADQIAEIEREALRQLRLEAKATAMFAALKSATLADIDAWVDSNFATLSAAQRRFLKLLAAAAGMYLRER